MKKMFSPAIVVVFLLMNFAHQSFADNNEIIYTTASRTTMELVDQEWVAGETDSTIVINFVHNVANNTITLNRVGHDDEVFRIVKMKERRQYIEFELDGAGGIYKMHVYTQDKFEDPQLYFIAKEEVIIFDLAKR